VGGSRVAYSVVVGNLAERDHWEDLGLDVRTILKLILKKEYGSLDCIDLTHSRDRDGLF
jgi:hypothetical protein